MNTNYLNNNIFVIVHAKTVVHVSGKNRLWPLSIRRSSTYIFSKFKFAYLNLLITSLRECSLFMRGGGGDG